MKSCCLWEKKNTKKKHLRIKLIFDVYFYSRLLIYMVMSVHLIRNLVKGLFWALLYQIFHVSMLHICHTKYVVAELWISNKNSCYTWIVYLCVRNMLFFFLLYKDNISDCSILRKFLRVECKLFLMWAACSKK